MENEEYTITVLNDDDKSFLKSKTPAVLPDNPSDKRWSASQIKIKMYEGFLVLFEWLKRISVEGHDSIYYLGESNENILNGLSIVGKSYADGEGNNIYNTYETKVDAEYKVSRNNLVTVIGSATQGESGLLSAEDKQKLDSMQSPMDLASKEDIDALFN